MKLKRIERTIIQLIQIWDVVSLNSLEHRMIQRRRIISACLNRLIKAGLVIRVDVNQRRSLRSLHEQGFCYYRLTAKGQNDVL